MNPTLSTRRATAAALFAAMTILAACGSGGGDDAAVATLDEGAAAEQASPEAAQASEEEVLDYVACLRDQGLDIEDPEVDADGNLTLRPGGGGGGGAPGGGAGGSDVRQQIGEATEACGEPPNGGFGGGGGDQTERQDAALEYAECMRGEGIDMDDPDFNNPGAAFADVDRDSSEFQAANEECQDTLTALRDPSASEE